MGSEVSRQSDRAASASRLFFLSQSEGARSPQFRKSTMPYPYIKGYAIAGFFGLPNDAQLRSHYLQGCRTTARSTCSRRSAPTTTTCYTFFQVLVRPQERVTWYPHDAAGHRGRPRKPKVILGPYPNLKIWPDQNHCGYLLLLLRYLPWLSLRRMAISILVIVFC
jgi:hypothetical protein